MKIVFYCVLAVMPQAVKKFIYNTFFGCDIHKTAFIGMSYIQAKKIKMGAHSRIKHLNIFANLELIELGEYATIGNLNIAKALPLGSTIHFQSEKDRYPALILMPHSSIVKKHYFDCNNTISIGHHSLIAGYGTAFFTHAVNIKKNRQESAPITIGNYCMIGARSTIVKGAILPDCSILGANSTLHTKFDACYTLYSGVPAVAVKKLDPNSGFFTREIGRVG